MLDYTSPQKSHTIHVVLSLPDYGLTYPRDFTYTHPNQVVRDVLDLATKVRESIPKMHEVVSALNLGAEWGYATPPNRIFRVFVRSEDRTTNDTEFNDDVYYDHFNMEDLKSFLLWAMDRWPHV